MEIYTVSNCYSNATALGKRGASMRDDCHYEFMNTITLLADGRVIIGVVTMETETINIFTIHYVLIKLAPNWREWEGGSDGKQIHYNTAALSQLL